MCSLEIGDNIADMEHKIPAVYSILLIDKLRHYSGGTGKDYSFWKSAREKKYKSDLINIYKKINNDKDDDKDAVTKLKGKMKNDGYEDDFINLLVANMYAYAYAHSYCNQAKLSVKFTKIVNTDKCSYCLETNSTIIDKFTKLSNKVYKEIKKSTWIDNPKDDGSKITSNKELYKTLKSDEFRKELHSGKPSIDPSVSKNNKIKKVRMSSRSYSNLEDIEKKKKEGTIFNVNHITNQFSKLVDTLNPYISKSNNIFTKSQLFNSVQNSLKSTYHANVIREGRRTQKKGRKPTSNTSETSTYRKKQKFTGGSQIETDKTLTKRQRDDKYTSSKRTRRNHSNS